MIAAVLRPLSLALCVATAVDAQPVEDRERGLFVLETHDRIRTASSEGELQAIALDIRENGHLLDYDSTDWLFDAIDDQREWLDPVNDPVFWGHYERLGTLVEHSFRHADAGVATERAMEAQWRFYEEMLAWQRDNPGFSGMDRVRHSLTLLQEIADSPEFMPAARVAE